MSLIKHAFYSKIYRFDLNNPKGQIFSLKEQKSFATNLVAQFLVEI